MASFTPLDNFKSRSRGPMPTGIVIDKSCRVYVTQIPLERIERDGASAMKAEFEVYGPLESYKMFTDRSGRFVGSALCTYRNPADASMAVYCMDGVEVDGATLHVEPAKEHGVVLLSSGSGSGAGRGAGRDHSRGFLRDTQRQWVRGGRGMLGGRGGARAGADDASTAPSSGPHAEGDRMAEEFSGDVDNASPDDGKWSHDKYQMLAEGKDMDEVLGIRRSSFQRGGARGRGGRSGHRYGEGIDTAFERYIFDRDASREDDGLAGSMEAPPSYASAASAGASSLSIVADVQPTPATVPAESTPAESAPTPLAEVAFGGDDSNAPVTGAELGALTEEE